MDAVWLLVSAYITVFPPINATAFTFQDLASVVFILGQRLFKKILFTFIESRYQNIAEHFKTDEQ